MCVGEGRHVWELAVVVVGSPCSRPMPCCPPSLTNIFHTSPYLQCDEVEERRDTALAAALPAGGQHLQPEGRGRSQEGRGGAGRGEPGESEPQPRGGGAW